ncbi:hypothetical protein E4U53_003721, partial [Claviceps sorghi]
YGKNRQQGSIAIDDGEDFAAGSAQSAIRGVISHGLLARGTEKGGVLVPHGNTASRSTVSRRYDLVGGLANRTERAAAGG